jgi:Flp pilus assembly protein TadG
MSHRQDSTIPSNRPFNLPLKRWIANQSGNVGILFGACAIVLTTTVGGAVDYGRWLNARSQTQNALDAATLVAGRELQLTGDAAKATKAADTYYHTMKSQLTVNDTVQFVALNNNTVVEAHGGAYVDTPFLSIIGIERLTVVADAATPTTVCIGPTCPAAGGGGTSGNSGTSIEISIMLDTTGSMDGAKLDALKVAAKELVDIVIWDDQSEYTSKVALVPFSDSVNVGSYYNAVTNRGAAGTQLLGYKSYNYPQNSTCYRANGKLKSSCYQNPIYGVGPIYCKVAGVVERIGVNQFKAAPPSGTGTAPDKNVALTPAILSSTNDTMMPWDGNSTCHETSEIMPLTKDKVALKTAIDGLIANNGTAGQLGTTWAWYMLSPEWSTIFTGSAAPRPYSELTQLGDTGQPKLRKIAILMTDGAYNTYQTSSFQDGSTQALAIQARARQVCQAMKDTGILVYTIGFQLAKDLNAIRTLTDCSSTHTIDTGASVHNFYNVETPESLQAAFRDIALQISKLRLSH